MFSRTRVSAAGTRGSWLLLAVLGLVLGALALVPHRADAVIWGYSGSFSRPDGAVRCKLTPTWAACLSMQTGRVVVAGSTGLTTTYFASTPVVRGRSTRQALVNRTRTIACLAGRRYVTCLVQGRDSGFTLDSQYTLTNDFGYKDFLDDSPPVAPVPVGYVPPSYYAPSNVIPDHSDPGGTYGTISPVTGLPRTYYVRPYVRRDGTYVSGYYRSCSRCAG